MATNDSTAREYKLICGDARYQRVADILSVPQALILGRIVVRVEPTSGGVTTTARKAPRRKTATKRTRRTARKSSKK